jgi:arsenical pump membrane protein
VPLPLSHALGQTWSPFVLVAGLLLIGAAAAGDHLFEAAGTLLARTPGGGVRLFVALMSLVVVVTVILNLDTSVVFLTPIVLHAARRRRFPEAAFLYGVIYLSNAASLLLPGSNLTNLLVARGVNAVSFARGTAPAWAAAVLVVAAVVLAWRWRDLRPPAAGPAVESPVVTARWGPGAVGVAGAVVLVLAVPDPALPMLGLGLAVVAVQILTGRLAPRGAAEAASPATLLILFALSVALGVVARTWSGPQHLTASLGPVATAWVAAGLSCVINNLPAAVLLSARAGAHTRALLVGLDLGPNLAVTGSLAALVWLRIARAEGARPSVRTYTVVGVVLVPLSMTAALVALGLVG